MLVDIIITILFFSAFVRGRELGLARQLLSTLGFFGGLLIGALLEPHIVGLAHTTLSRSLLTLCITLGCAIIFVIAGEYLGIYLKEKIKLHKIDKADVFTGAIAGGLTLLIAVWLLAPIIVSLPFTGLQSALKQSYIVSELSTNLPASPNVIADIGRLIDPNGFPQVFNGLEPAPRTDIAVPSLSPLHPAVVEDEASVVKIAGNGCGGIVEGSGFVAAPGLVATNAHVIAGVKNPTVIDGNGQHNATPIWFDPDLDFAVLRVSNLAGDPLTISTSHLQTGSDGAVLGYPGGGGFSAQPAAVLDEFIANGRNIYGQGSTNRDVYELKANIIPGNSGGPLINSKAEVTGVVFAESTAYNKVGYALATKQIKSELTQAKSQNQVTSTGSCAE